MYIRNEAKKARSNLWTSYLTVDHECNSIQFKIILKIKSRALLDVAQNQKLEINIKYKAEQLIFNIFMTELEGYNNYAYK